MMVTCSYFVFQSSQKQEVQFTVETSHELLRFFGPGSSVDWSGSVNIPWIALFVLAILHTKRNRRIKAMLYKKQMESKPDTKVVIVGCMRPPAAETIV